MSASLEMRRALVAGLKADLGIASRMIAVVDAPTVGLKPPYLTLGPDIATDWSTKTEAGREHRLRVTVYERPLQVARAYAALERVEAVVAALPAALAGHRIVWVRFLRSFVEAAADGGAVTGLIEFRARTRAD